MSELHAKATEKAGDVRKVLDRYEKYKKTVSENMHEHIEYLRVIEELTEVKAIIAGLKNKEKALSDTKERVNKLNSLLMSVSRCKLQTVTHKREKHCLTSHSS